MPCKDEIKMCAQKIMLVSKYFEDFKRSSVRFFDQVGSPLHNFDGRYFDVVYQCEQLLDNRSSRFM